MSAHFHRWRLLAATPASDAVCRECGERRRFSGGVRSESATSITPNDRTWVTPTEYYRRRAAKASAAGRRRAG